MAVNTRQKILDYGRTEFLQKGYEGASMRAIANAAGVTTGAIYGCFPDKEALFDALVAQPAQELLDQYFSIHKKFAERSAEMQAHEMNRESSEGLLRMVDYVYRHYEAFKLLICRAAGTSYEGYLDSMVEIEDQATKQFISVLRQAGWKVRDVDDDLIHILSSSFFSGIFEFVSHDMSREKAEDYIKNLQEFYFAGWLRLLDIKPPSGKTST